MPKDAAFIWDEDRPAPPQRPRPDPIPDHRDRIDLREASRRFGVSPSTLGAWARKGAIDAVMVGEGGKKRWMAVPESVAHHLAGRKRKGGGKSARSAPGRTSPTADGAAMLVPRDAWDRLIEQLGNLHEAGMALAESRERAAKAETEAGFLRERLGEMRSERDALRSRVDGGANATDGVRPPSGWDRIRRWLAGPGR